MPARSIHPELKTLVAEASRALARLDADRLEELALSCRALNRDLERAAMPDRLNLARQVREAQPQMAAFARILDATRANLAVTLERREHRRGRPLEYRAHSARRLFHETGYGDH
jgi:hypothetical protein